MYRKCIGSDPTAARLDFALYEVAGEWESRSGSPRVRIYRNPGRRGGGVFCGGGVKKRGEATRHALAA